MTPVPACLCGAGQPLHRRGHRHLCPACGSFWDDAHLAAVPRYAADYAQARNHFDPLVGRLKRRSLDRWLGLAGVGERLAGLRVCEVGFGGGACLIELHRQARAAFGIEADSAHLDHARSLGVPAHHLFAAAALPSRLPTAVDLWLFQDSFEHLPDPVRFLGWLSANSADDAQVVLVAPLAGSWSERLAGRWWPHRVPDHAFHWSARGLQRVWSAAGFAVERRFFPWKDVSVEMLVRHFGVLSGRPWPLPPGAQRLSLPFNVGEIGLVLRRRRCAA